MKAMSKIWQKQATMMDKQLSQNQDENLNTAIENVRKEDSKSIENIHKDIHQIIVYNKIREKIRNCHC